MCLLMTVGSISMLFAHQLYDAICTPAFPVQRRFRLRRLGSNLNVTGLLLFIAAMLLVVSMVSVLITLVASLASCLIMTLYIERRLVGIDAMDEELEKLLPQDDDA